MLEFDLLNSYYHLTRKKTKYLLQLSFYLFKYQYHFNKTILQVQLIDLSIVYFVLLHVIMLFYLHVLFAIISHDLSRFLLIDFLMIK